MLTVTLRTKLKRYYLLQLTCSYHTLICRDFVVPSPKLCLYCADVFSIILSFPAKNEV